MTKKSIFLDTINGKPSKRPPVWFMRQAGRALPSYQKLKDNYTFKELMLDPKLACEVTLLPVWDLGVDAAILFSDILVIPEALGMKLDFPGKGPVFENPLAFVDNAVSHLKYEPSILDYIYEAIRLIKSNKPEDVALIGFSGGPFTVLCYMLQGISHNHAFPDAIKYVFQNEAETSELLDVVTEATIDYALKQVQSGIDAFQIFETHAGLVPSTWFSTHIIPCINRIAAAVRKTGTPVIFFPRGYGFGLMNLTSESGDYIGVDWQTDLFQAREALDTKLGLQGNLDPRILLADQKNIEKELNRFIDFGSKNKNWIFNLGHGILPDTPVENISFVVDWIKNADWKRKL